MDNYTKDFDPHHKYEDFETYVKKNISYIEAAQGYLVLKIDARLTNRLLNDKPFIDADEYPAYANILKKYDADFTYDCEDSIKGYDDITGKFGSVCRVAFLPKEKFQLSIQDAKLLESLLINAIELNKQKVSEYEGLLRAQKEYVDDIRGCRAILSLLNKYFRRYAE